MNPCRSDRAVEALGDTLCGGLEREAPESDALVLVEGGKAELDEAHGGVYLAGVWLPSCVGNEF